MRVDRSASAIQLASEQDNEVTVVDMDDERLDKLSSNLISVVIEGNASSQYFDVRRC